MSDLADSLAIKRAIEQVVDERIAKITDVCFRVYKALVISVNGDKMTVNILGDKLDDTITIPYSTAVSDAVRGDYVLVATTYNSWRNAVVWQKWNFKSPDGGGKIEVDTEMSDSSTNAVQNRVIKSYVDEVAGTKQDQLSETQLAAVNSGITQSKVTRYDELNQVEANPSQAGSYELTKLQVGNIVYNVPTGGGEIPSGTPETAILFGDGQWRTPVVINGVSFKDFSDKSASTKKIWAPVIGSPFATDYSGNIQYYANSRAKAYCATYPGSTVPAWFDTFDSETYEMFPVTYSLPTNATAKAYTIARDLRWCRAVTFMVGHKDGHFIINTITAAMLHNSTFVGKYFTVDDSSNGFQIMISNMSSTSNGESTTITVKNSSYNNLTKGLYAFLLY